IGSTSNALNVNISGGSVPLPTGAATAALQTAGNTTLSNISTQLPGTIGPNAASASLSIVPATSTTFTVNPNSGSQWSQKPNANGSGSGASSTVSTVTTLSAPGN